MPRTLALLAICASFGFAIDSADLNPMQLGDTRTFDVQSPSGIRPLIVMEVTQMFGNWAQVSNHPLTNGSGWFRNANRDEIVQWVGGHRETIIETDAGLNHGWSFASTNQCHTTNWAQLVDENLTLTTAAGTFSNCRVYNITGNCRGAGVTQMIMAPGVGLVGWDEYSLLGPIEFRLKEATIGGVQYPVPFQSLAFAAVTDKRVYTQGGGAPGSTPTTATISVQAELRNQTSQDFQFWQSGKEFDVTLTEAGSTVPVTTWSLGKFFHKALIQKTLAAGDTMTWQVSLPAANDAGQRLNGEYILRFWLIGQGVNGYAAELPIKILFAPTPVPTPVPLAPAVATPSLIGNP